MERIIEAFMDPGLYNHEVKDVKLLQTHISYVFLTGKYAYKIKKPVNFGFVDFSTLEKRKQFCEKELAVNRRLCGKVYIKVLPVTDDNGKIAIDGGGKVVEYVLKMLELPQERIMSRMLEKGQVTEKHVREIAKIVSGFHKSESIPEISKYGSVKAVKELWDENFRQTAEFVGTTIKEEKYAFIKNAIGRFIENNQQLFEKRIRNGKIKDCHGDLHAGNIFISDKIYIFDAVEFNESFRCSDTLADIAFFLMELEFKGRKDLADAFLDEYAKIDEEEKKLLDFYKCYRAYVRGKVLSFKLNDKAVSEEGKKHSAEQAKKYFDSSCEYAKIIS